MKLIWFVPFAALVAAFVLVLPGGWHAGLGASPPVWLSPESGSEASALYPVAATWTPPEPVRQPSSSVHGLNPALAVHGQTGIVHLAWEEEGIIRYASRNGLGWQVDPNLALAGDSPAMGLDTEGWPHIVYVSLVGGQLRILHCARLVGGWAPPQLVSSTAGPSTDPDIALLSNGEIHVLWADRLDGTQQIYHARSTDGGNTWFSVQPIPGAEGYAPSLASGPNETLWTAWQSAPTTDGQAQIALARWDGQDWTEPVLLSTDLIGDSRHPDVGCDAKGQVHVIWEVETAEGDTSVQYMTGQGTDWSAPLRLSPLTDAQATQPFLVLGSDGAAYVAWDAGMQLDLRRRTSTGLWRGVEAIVQNEAGIRQVALATDNGGAVCAVWSARNDEQIWEIYFSQRAPETAPTPSLRATDTPTQTATTTPTASGAATATATHTATAEPTSPPAPSPTQSAAETPTATGTPSPGGLATASPTVAATTPPLAEVYVPVVLRTGPATVPAGAAVSHIQPTQRDQGPRPTQHGWTWFPVESISNLMTDARAATLAVTTNGTAYVVWEEPLDDDLTILAYSIRSRGIWSVPEYFFIGEEPDLAVGPDNRVHLVYANEFDGNYDIFYTTWQGEGWSTPQNVSNTSGTSTQPALAILEDGRPITLWTDTTEGYNRIYYGWRADGIWNTFIVPASSNGSMPDVAVGENGRVWATWQAPEDDMGRYDIYAINGAGTSWSSLAINLSDSPNVDSILARIAGMSSRGAFVAWQENAGNAEIYYADNLEWHDWWSPPYNASESMDESIQPAIVANENDVHIAWDEGITMLHRYRSADGAWSPRDALNAGPEDVREIELARGPARDIHALWAQSYSPADHDLYYRAGNWEGQYGLMLPLIILQ